jgi:hypothetical protein
MPRALFAVLTLAALAPAGRAAPKDTTGNAYRAYSDDIKAVYVMGVLDGFLVAPGFGAPRKELAWLEACSVGMSGNQVAAIADKYLRDRPEHWNQPMNGLVYGGDGQRLQGVPQVTERRAAV